MTALNAPPDDLATAERLQGRLRTSSCDELRKIIVGQDDVIEQALIALVRRRQLPARRRARLAKTLLIHTLAQALDLKFSRIQFTPDLMPSDITGTDIIQDDPATGQRRLSFTPGPVFANILLADEINRTPPKTQAALLEAMQEHRVTVQGRTYTLEPPFFVFATQNPIELEGTYPLPEAQLDRFMFEVILDYLPEEDEVEVVRATTAIQEPMLSHAVIGRGDPRVPAARAPRARGRAGLALRGAARPRARRPSEPDAPSSSSSGSPTAPACAPRRA